MPGGFHPFHAGHASLYQSALKAFPNADVFVAATNDTKTRPFPFEIKEKLAKVAGVQDGRFVQVKSPFQAKEILQNYDPEKDIVVFVRSEKDRDEQPKPGGTKKDGSPAYFQPYTGKNLEPFGKHGYIAYLPTVEFGPGIKSATEIRNIWPQLNDRRKLAMVMSLYPKAKENQRLAQNIVKMLDLGMGSNEEVAEGILDRFKKKPTRDEFIRQKLEQLSTEELRSLLRDYKGRIPNARSSGSLVGGAVADYANAVQTELDKRAFKDFTTKNPKWDTGMNEAEGQTYSARQAQIFKDLGDGYFLGDDSYDDDDGFTKEGYTVYYQEGDDQFRQVSYVSMSPYSNPSGHVENEIKKIISSDQNSMNEDKEDSPFSDLESSYRHPDTNKILQFARHHYPEQPDLQGAFVKFVLRSLKHSEEDSERHEDEIENLNKRIDSIEDTIKDLHSTKNNKKVNEGFDYLEEK